MHLLVAECLMHLNRLGEAHKVLENIRENRIITDRYEALPPFATRADAFAVIKQLQAGENFARHINFVNLKRWNSVPEFAANMYRTILGTTYTLRPNSPLWIFPFPQSSTDFNPTLTQNF
jgi:hypothetical protein